MRKLSILLLEISMMPIGDEQKTDCVLEEAFSNALLLLPLGGIPVVWNDVVKPPYSPKEMVDSQAWR